MNLDDGASGRGIAALSAQDAGAQEVMAFLLRLRARGISDLDVLRSLELVPRLAFAPHRYADLALRDMALPIPCGQAMSEPFALAKVLEALRISEGRRILEIGTGSGYGTALLARVGGEIVSYERYRTLALEADLRLKSLGVVNASVIWGDGLDDLAATGLFDRVFVDGSVSSEALAGFVERLAEGGVLVASSGGRLLRIAHVRGEFVRDDLGASSAAALAPSLARAM